MFAEYDKNHGLLSCLAPQAILFDCDGTLLLTSDLHFKAISTAIARQGSHMSYDWYTARTGLGRSDLFAQFSADFAVNLDLPSLVHDSVTLTVSLSSQARENPLVASIARQAAGRLPIAVVTNSEAAIANAFLSDTSLHDLFEFIVSREDARSPKPAPDLYQEAAMRLGISAEHCLVLEDSDEGIQAAASAGMSCLDVRSSDWPQHYERLLVHLANICCGKNL
jgi:beta-phosphoglucomutase-like phosphatase (HAD superfamily)